MFCKEQNKKLSVELKRIKDDFRRHIYINEALRFIDEEHITVDNIDLLFDKLERLNIEIK